jgi:putative tricarboxylic transport membrane protein
MTQILPQQDAAPTRIIVNQTMVGGFVMIALGGMALFFTRELDFGNMAEIGPGFLPRVIALLIGLLGIVIFVAGWNETRTKNGLALEAWAGRPVFAILLAVAIFGVLIRGMSVGLFAIPALGLSVAAPVCALVAGMADRQTSWRDLVILALVLTVGTILLFRFVLRLSIPVAPWLIGY